MIAIRLIALHMIIGDSRCCISIDAGRCGKGAGWTLCVMAEFGRKLMYAGEGTTKRGEIHHDTFTATLCQRRKELIAITTLFMQSYSYLKVLTL